MRKGKYAKRGYRDIEKEMVQRGEEISRMIRIFGAIRHMLPEGPRVDIEKVARQYAERNDADRGSVMLPGHINFNDDGIRGVSRAKAEKINDRQYKIKL